MLSCSFESSSRSPLSRLFLNYRAGGREWGALLLSLSLDSLLAFIDSWSRDQDFKGLSSMARETLILVPLGLPFFVPLAFAERLGFGFGTSH